MGEKEKNGQAPSDKDSIDDSDLMNLLDEVKSTLDDEEEIIELTEAVDGVETKKEAELAEGSDVIIKDLDDDLGADEYVKDDFAASLGMKIDTDPDFSLDKSEPEVIDLGKGEGGESGAITISPRQLEDAIERVVNKMLGEKIDAMLSKSIERAVSQEIIRLKNILRVSSEEETD